jgi:ABC-type phosphate/phosphonate transport system permease subunit
MLNEEPKVIREPFLGNATLAFLFIHLARFSMRAAKDVRFKEAFTTQVKNATTAMNKLYREAFNQVPTQHREAIEETGGYYFYAVALANQAEDMEGMIKCMLKFLEKEQSNKKQK